ncbi:PP2C family protein-serine/threonine phosphatase [Streptomyces sp. NPDC048636]|uniref:PP2C family protein-serine/threonine phosphatase n=1 Tax=Streptomyces sp. NPDC048636 TaxID=3155762 RepID=UPI0034212703
MRARLDFTRRDGSRRRPPPALYAIPVGILLVITVIDVNAPPHVHLGPFLIAAPAITASFASARGTAAIGVLAVIAQIVIGILHGGLTTANHQAQISALIVISALVASFRYATDRHRRRLRQVRSVAVAAQEVLLRPLPGRVGPLRIASVYISAEEEAQIGGDLYAAVRGEEATRLVIGDVRGKGLPAVGDAAVLIGAFRGSAYRKLSLPGLTAHLGQAVRWNWRHTPGRDQDALESFVTAVVLDVYDDRPVVDMINCGHPPPLLLHGGALHPVDGSDPALPLGMADSSDGDYTIDAFTFEDNDLLVLYTDGFVEARDAGGTFYPMTERLAGRDWGSPEELVRYLHDDLLRYAGGRVNDDAAVVAIARCPEESSTAPA